MHRALFGLGCLALAGCADIAGLSGGSAQVTRLALYGGDVVAAGPQGYCVDPRSSRPADGFAVLAGCDVITGQGQAAGPAGFVTVQVGAAATGLGPDMASLPDLLRGDGGRSLLSQTGQPGDIRVQGATLAAGGATVRFTDEAAPPVSGLQQSEWRGFLDIDDRLTTVSVRGLAAAPLGTDEGQGLLQGVMQAMRQVNGATTP